MRAAVNSIDFKWFHSLKLQRMLPYTANNENRNCFCDIPDTEHNQSPKSTVLNEVLKEHFEKPIQNELNFIMQL